MGTIFFCVLQDRFQKANIDTKRIGYDFIYAKRVVLVKLERILMVNEMVELKDSMLATACLLKKGVGNGLSLIPNKHPLMHN